MSLENSDSATSPQHSDLFALSNRVFRSGQIDEHISNWCATVDSLRPFFIDPLDEVAFHEAVLRGPDMETYLMAKKMISRGLSNSGMTKIEKELLALDMNLRMACGANWRKANDLLNDLPVESRLPPKKAPRKDGEGAEQPRKGIKRALEITW